MTCFMFVLSDRITIFEENWVLMNNYSYDKNMEWKLVRDCNVY